MGDDRGSMSHNSSLAKVSGQASLGSVADSVMGGDGGDGGAKGLGLDSAPHLSLERLGDGLVGGLSSTTDEAMMSN